MEIGVRQGDPLSPFLYLVAAEWLNVTIKEAISCGYFKGVKIGSSAIPMPHLQYVDDTLIFEEWIESNARNLMRILECGDFTEQHASNRLVGGKWGKIVKVGRMIDKTEGAGDLDELTHLIDFFVSNVLELDSWRWIHDVRIFTVKRLREMIDDKILNKANGIQEAKWNKLIPRKIVAIVSATWIAIVYHGSNGLEVGVSGDWEVRRRGTVVYGGGNVATGDVYFLPVYVKTQFGEKLEFQVQTNQGTVNDQDHNV
ncbi:hypothetical protein Tco_0381812 [Tanacetum coccineum]